MLWKCAGVRVAVVAGADPGHVCPAIALCLRFLEAGDVPTLCTVDPWVDAAADLGIATVRLNGLAPGRELDLGRALHDRAAMLAPVLAPLLADLKPDLVVCDVIAQGGGMAAELLGLPWAQLSPHPLYEPSRGLPPIGSGLAAGVGPLGKLRDAMLRTAASRSIRQGELQRARARQSVGLPPRGPGPSLRLIATLPALEVARPDWPSSAHVVGPLLWEAARQRLEPPPGDDPLVVIAPSTASSGAEGLASTALAALRGMGLRAVVSTFGPAPADLPSWARSGQGRQDELLREASVVVCGGGHGLLAKALLAGVPAVIVPGGGDQWEMANRVARQGSGLLVRPSTVDTLRAAVTRVLADPAFASAAALAGASAADVTDPVEVCATRGS